MWMAIAAYLQGTMTQRDAAALLAGKVPKHWHTVPPLTIHIISLNTNFSAVLKVPLLPKLPPAHPRPTPAAFCSCVASHHQGCAASQLPSLRQSRWTNVTRSQRGIARCSSLKCW